MNESPFFSILIPTKNRSHLVGYAIRSVLQQDFEDFEVIVCDNDDDEVATRQVVEQFLDDPRVIYIRSGGLDMVANWNRALEAASGQNISVLEDKMIFYPGALTAISRDIEGARTGVVVWGCDVVEDDGSPKLIQRIVENAYTIQTEQVLYHIVTDVMKSWSLLPRGLCCSIPRVLIDAIEDRSGQPFYGAVSPDFVSAIKVISAIDEYVVSDGVYSLITSNKVSSGKSMSRRKSQDVSYFMGTKKLNLDHSYVYMKSEWIVVNTVIGDYMKLRDQLGGRLAGFSVSNKRYFQMLLRELIITSKAERRLVWTRQEVAQLFSRGDGLTANLLYLTQYVNGLIINKLKGKLSSTYAKTRTMELPAGVGAPEFVEQYLGGKFRIENRGYFL